MPSYLSRARSVSRGSFASGEFWQRGSAGAVFAHGHQTPATLPWPRQHHKHSASHRDVAGAFQGYLAGQTIGKQGYRQACRCEGGLIGPDYFVRSALLEARNDLLRSLRRLRPAARTRYGCYGSERPAPPEEGPRAEVRGGWIFERKPSPSASRMGDFHISSFSPARQADLEPDARRSRIYGLAFPAYTHGNCSLGNSLQYFSGSHP